FDEFETVRSHRIGWIHKPFLQTSPPTLLIDIARGTQFITRNARMTAMNVSASRSEFLISVFIPFLIRVRPCSCLRCHKGNTGGNTYLAPFRPRPKGVGGDRSFLLFGGNAATRSLKRHHLLISTSPYSASKS